MAAMDLLAEKHFRRESYTSHRSGGRPGRLARLGEAVVSVLERLLTWEPAGYRSDFSFAR